MMDTLPELVETHGELMVSATAWMWAAGITDRDVAEAVELAVAADGVDGLVDLAAEGVLDALHVGELAACVDRRAKQKAQSALTAA